MKIIRLTIFLLFLSALGAKAQTTKLCPEMNAFYEYCLDVRTAVEQNNLSALENCIAEWDGESSLEYKGVEFEIAAFHKNDILYVDTLGMANLKGHLQFDPAFVDSLIANGAYPDTLDVPDITRGSRDCTYTHVGIKADKQISMSIMTSGECELFLVSEDGAAVTASITLNDNKKAFLKETSSAPCFKWDMKDCGTCQITIKNPSKRDISVIIASN